METRDTQAETQAARVTFNLRQLLLWTAGISLALTIDGALAAHSPWINLRGPLSAVQAALVLIAALYHGLTLVGLVSLLIREEREDAQPLTPPNLVLAWCGIDTLMAWGLLTFSALVPHAPEPVLLVALLAYGVVRFASLLWIRVQIAEQDPMTRAIEWIALGGAMLIGMRVGGWPFQLLAVFALPLILFVTQTWSDLVRQRTSNVEDWAGLAALVVQCSGVVLATILLIAWLARLGT